MFASCANNSDSDDKNPGSSSTGNPNTPLPANVGTNPIKEEITLMPEDDEDRYLVLRNDGTALEIHCDYDHNEEEETYATFKYTYNDEERTISMKMDKCLYDVEYFAEDKLLTYDEILSRINEDLTVEKIRQSEKAYYLEEIEEDEDFKKEFPNYADYEMALVKDSGYASFEDYVKSWKQECKNDYKSGFGAQVTYAYKIENDKMVLTEKFTGVRNLFGSKCEYENYNDGKYIDAGIDCSYVNIRDREDDSINRFEEYYYGFPNADKGTIELVKERRTRTEDWKYEYEALVNVTATYKEDIPGKTVTIKCEGKEYVCEFKGQKFIQE